MLFTKLKLNYFGRFVNREIELKPGLNLIYGENEAGKSTIHIFIRGMLFGIERMRGRGAASKEDIYTRYLPWDYPGAYGGSMDIRLGDKDYRLQRSFHANDKSFTIIELSTGREVKLKEGHISELIPGLTESTYRNTISIEQLKAATDTELAAQVRNYIANLSIAKSKEVNVAQAVSDLNDRRKQLEAAQNTVALKALQAAIEAGEEREEQMDALTVKLRELLAEGQSLSELNKQLSLTVDEETLKLMEQLPAVLEKYRSFQSLTKQEKNLWLEGERLKEEIADRQGKDKDTAKLKEDLERLKQLQNELKELDKTDLELKGERERLNRRTGMYAAVSMLPATVLAFAVWGFKGFHINGLLLFSLIMIAGVIGLTVLLLHQSQKLKVFRARLMQAGQTRASLEIQGQNILKAYGVTRQEDLSLKQEEAIRNTYALEQSARQSAELEKRRSELEDNRDMLYEEIMRYQQHFTSEEELTDASVGRLREVIEEKRRKASDRQVSISRQQEDNRLSVEKLRWELSSLEHNEEELITNRERYLELEQKQKEAEAELEAVKLALSVIGELSADIHDSFGQQLNSAVTGIIREITGDRYNDLKVDEKLEVKVGWKGDYIMLDRLSAGTIDQIYFALRTAVADLLLGQDEAPLMLDDSLALYDESRVRACLKELAQKKQVILFTCHKRERQLLDELGISYHQVELSQE